MALTLSYTGAGIGTVGCGSPPPGPDVEWTHYGGDAGGSKYSLLADISRDNVDRVKTAWMVRAGDFPPDVFDSLGRTDMPRDSSPPVRTRPGARCGSCRFEATPLMLGGTLYISTPLNRVLALDPATGATRWTFDPQINITRSYAEDLTSRGVSAWANDTASLKERCTRRIFLASVDARLHALDAATGLPCERFGDSGFVRLNIDVGLNQSQVETSRYTVTSPPAIIGDLVVVGSALSKGWRRDVASGVVRAYDARTGALRWSFDPIPRTRDHPSWEFWTPDAARSTGGANVWSIISADAERDLVFLPIASPAPESYGGGRLGRNDFANSLVALRASTGKVVWSFQTVHHDLWDYDVAAQPVLVNLRRGGQEIPAVIVANKAGMIFVLHRETGLPLLPVEEQAVPASDVEGEVSWPSQPFARKAPMLHGNLLTPDSAFGINDVDRAFCREQIARLRNEGTFTPPSLQGTLVWPGYWGGINWDGIAWDPDRQLIVTTVKRLATVVQLRPRDVQRQPPDAQPGLHSMPQFGTPYSMSRSPLVARSGIPCTPPPWGSLVAAAAGRWIRTVAAAARESALARPSPQLRYVGINRVRRSVGHCRRPRLHCSVAGQPIPRVRHRHRRFALGVRAPRRRAGSADDVPISRSAICRDRGRRPGRDRLARRLDCRVRAARSITSNIKGEMTNGVRDATTKKSPPLS